MFNVQYKQNINWNGLNFNIQYEIICVLKAKSHTCLLVSQIDNNCVWPSQDIEL